MNNSITRVSRQTAVLLSVAVVLCASFSTTASMISPSSSDDVEHTYFFSQLHLHTITIENKVYDHITLQDSPLSGNAGEPLLPTRGAYLLLPPKTTVASITVTGEAVSLGSGFTIVPCGASLPLTPDAAQMPPEPDPTIYSSDDMFPGVLSTHVGVHPFRGYTILVVMLHPVQYQPLSGQLFYYPSLDVRVTLEEEPFGNSMFRGLPIDEELVLQKIDNPEGAPLYHDLLHKNSRAEDYDLLILTSETFTSAFTPLAAQHNQTGTQTIIRTLTDVGGSTPEDIRDYLRTAYTTWGISYVLLGGDTEVVPEKMLWVLGMDENVTPYETFMPADVYYACLDGTYNYDGDNKWGEPTDGENGSDVDLIADVYVGRACASTLTEVEYFVNKTLTYLTVPDGDTYLGAATFAGEYLGDHGIASYGSAMLNQLINGSNDNGFTTVGIPASTYMIDTLYDETYPGGSGWPAQEIIDRINNGVHFINHNGHAYYEYNMRMGTSDVTDLTNTDQFCFVYSQGCMSGGFDQGDCIAEHFTAKTNHGAFAGIWNARYGFFWSYSTDGDSQRFHRQFWDAVFGENIRELGRANHDSKEDNLFLIQRSCIRWCYYETNLFGDPAVAFKQASGSKPSLSIHAVTGGRGISATISNEGDTPVTGVAWSISLQGGLLGRINIDARNNLAVIDVGETSTLQPDDPMFGLGKISIQVTVEYAEPWSGTGFVLGPFVLRVIRSC
ncbi:MAG: hypothetical protein JXA00_02945 [Candidatus Thermoplasmatota archaeon]|nr:hypothetical protein [Candidatus Thermoplasmatota archaeon]